MRRIVLLLSFLLVLTVERPGTAEEPPAADPKLAPAWPVLPAAWHGVWKGRCTTEGPKRKTQTFPMELHVAPIEGRRAWTWRIVYGEGATRQVRDYELLAVAGGEGHFRIDEKNGIVIDSWLQSGTLYSRFEVGKVSVDARYALRAGKLEVSLVTTRVAPVSTTGGTKRIPAVKTFALVAAQHGTLQKG